MYKSLADICAESEQKGLNFWEIIQREDCMEENMTAEQSFTQMQKIYQAMKEADQKYDPALKSASGLVGTEGEKVRKRRMNGEMICGELISLVMEKALKITESNACMKRIVAAPTAGSCGVVPAVLLSIQEKKEYSDEQMTKALYVAGGIGGVIASRASLSGAEGGCQAEIGSASAMAAGALTYLLGGDAQCMIQAAALALKGLLGLACDPVAGLVEVPCVKRNVIGAVNAITSADMALAGICSKIPPDEVIDAMRSIGRSMSTDIRETGKGGLAGTPTGILIRDQIAMQ